jgi:hypothetical protein
MAESIQSKRVSEPVGNLSTDDRFAARLRGFGPLGILAILIILGGNLVIAPLSAILVLIWVKFQTPPGARLVVCAHAAG